MCLVTRFTEPGTEKLSDLQDDLVFALEIIHDAVLSSRFLYLGRPVAVLVSMRLGELLLAIVEIMAKLFVDDARHEKAFASDVTNGVLHSFSAGGVAFAAHAA